MREQARDAVTRRSATGVDDTPSGVPSLERQVVIEFDTEVLEVADPRGRLGHEDVDGRLGAQPPSRLQRVLGMKHGAVVVTDRGGDPALRQRARRSEKRCLRYDEHPGLRGCAQCREQACHAAPDDNQVDGLGR